MPKPKTRPAPIPKPHNRTLHLKLDALLESDLDKIVVWMQSDPVLGRLRADIGREKAIRYAVVRCIAHPPEHVGGRGG